MSSAGSPRWASSQSITAARPVVVDDEVAEPEVAVHQRGAGRLGRVGAQPAQAELDRGQRLADLVELALPLVDLARAPGPRAPAGSTPSTSPGLERMDPGERLGELRRAAGPARRLVLRLAQDPRARPRSPRRTPSASPASRSGHPRARRRAARARGRPPRRHARAARTPRPSAPARPSPWGPGEAPSALPRPRPARSRARRRRGSGSASARRGPRRAPRAPRGRPRRARRQSPSASIRGRRLPLEPVALPVAVGDVGRVLVPVPDARVASRSPRAAPTDRPGSRSS